jgi:hypothetical protein
MRSGSPAVYLCGKSKDRGMHKWTRSDAGAKCVFCGIELTGDDAEDVFRGTRTPIGELADRQWRRSLAGKEEGSDHAD